MPDLKNPSSGIPSPGDRLTQAASGRLHRTNLDLVLDGGSARAVVGVNNLGRATSLSMAPLFYGLATSSTVGLGIFLGEESGAFKFRIGDPSGANLQWSGTALLIAGTIVATSLVVSGDAEIQGDLLVTAGSSTSPFTITATAPVLLVRASGNNISTLRLDDAGDVEKGIDLVWDGSAPDQALFKVSAATVWSVQENTTTVDFAGAITVAGALTASGGVDGVVGGVTPAAGSFTTLSTSSTLGVTGVTTVGGDILSDTDSTDNLGATGTRWANLWVDAITLGGTLAGAVATFSSTLVVTGTSTFNALLTADIGAPSAADKTIAVFQSESSRQIGLFWDDSESTLGIGTLSANSFVIHTGGNSNPALIIDTSQDSTFTGTLDVTGGITAAAFLFVTGATRIVCANTVSGTGLMLTTNDTSQQEIMRDSSTRRWKKDIDERFRVDVDAVLSIRTKEYGRPGADGRAIGFIVEDFHDAGFGNLIAYDDEGPAGFLDFGRGITALHQAVLRTHKAHILKLERKVARYEAGYGQFKQDFGSLVSLLGVELP